ncbi:hypothetical protein Cri9333_1019 [Crinalium epipsammum PCC 9333]|uniref:Uncharacterized protein n=1 Tax=Crinalium epipsammum PCC 9333 TaxID=1173022 RepID=K9VUZ8_9CYAN|nr:hypothetical protein [Crinalium epipsammum]AFZ11933.1 hypothetical protein Cri9333_1019 [Crinalium epipsammum PCC 9333]
MKGRSHRGVRAGGLGLYSRTFQGVGFIVAYYNEINQTYGWK